MKDAVKITVIATGFREMPTGRQRTQETRTSFASVHDDAMEFPEPLIMREAEETPQAGASGSESSYGEDHSPAPVSQISERAAADVISLETMRTAMVSNFEQEDLDVPAFLRKRNDVM